MNLDATPCVESVFKHFRRGSSTPTCEATRAENGFPVNSTETNLVGLEHRQKGEPIDEE